MGHVTITRRSLAAIAFAAGSPRSAQAQETWPARSVRLVVPYGPGGAADTLARLWAQKFPAFSGGQTLVVENRSGAGGTLGGLYVARQPPDGYTLMVGDIGPNVVGKVLSPALAYDPATAFTPLMQMAAVPALLISHPAVPERDLASIIAAAKRDPARFTYASAGVGNGSHLFMELLKREAGIDMTHVPYRSGAEAVTAVLRGDAHFAFPTLSSALQMIRGGQVRPVAIGNPGGTRLLSEMPPMAATLPGFDVSIWYGIAAPSGMAPALATRINAVLAQIAELPEVRSRVLEGQAGEVIGGSAEVFAALLQRETARWTPLIRAGGIRSE